MKVGSDRQAKGKKVQTAAEKLELGLVTEAEARELAAAERAAIRAASSLYTAPAKVTEAEAEARAARAAAEARAVDALGMLAGQIVQPDTAEAEARAARAAAARAALPAIVWVPAPKQPVKQQTEAEKAAARAEARWHASVARAMHAAELAEARAARERQADRAAVVHSAEVAMAELANNPAALAAAARKARATSKLAAAEARKAYLKETGKTEAEARADELLAESFELVHWASPDAVPSKRAKQDAGMASALSPAELAEVQQWTEAALNTAAARAGRAALDAIGPRASGLIVTSRKARKVQLAEVRKVPKVETAEARAARADKALAEARERLAEAEARVAAAEAEKAVQPIRKANSEADKLAAVVRTKAARAEAAAATLAEARKLAALPVTADGFTAVPVATFKLAEAARAAEVQLRERADRMPGKFQHRGPQAKGLHYRNDKTATEAIGRIMALTEAEIRAYWEETWKQINDLLAAKRAAEAAEAEARKAESEAARKAYKAAHERGRRAKQHSKR